MTPFRTLALFSPLLLCVLRLLLGLLLLSLPREVEADVLLDPTDGPHLDDVAAADLARDEGTGEDVGVVLLEGGFRYLKEKSIIKGYS
jgi:hypothetical protein